MKTINTTRKYLFVLLILIATIILGLVFESSSGIAFAEQATYPELSDELVQKFLSSDNFYNQLTDQDSSISTENIGNYYDNYWGTNVNGDDPIVLIIPKQIFWSVNSGTYIGKEYGFYFNTIEQNNFFNTDIFVFDFVTSSNLLTGEFFYKVVPLFVSKYGYSNSTGFVRPKDSTKVDYSNEYALNNVSYAFSVFNDNKPNYGSENYNKATDSGAIIRQTRYNMDGLIYGTTDWETASNQIIDVLVGSILETSIDLLVGSDPTGVVNAIFAAIKIAETAAEIGQIVNGMYIYDVVDNIINNDLNIITYPDKNSYELSQAYIRTLSITASNSIAYRAKHLYTDPDSGQTIERNNYSEGVLLLQDVGDPTRILSAISLNVVKFIENGSFQVIDSSVRCSDDLKYASNEIEEITCENIESIYLYPNCKTNFVFTPDYSSYYNFNHDQSAGYAYRIYKIISNQEQDIYLGNNLQSIYLDKDTNYYIEITKNEGNWYQSSLLTISFQSLSLPTTNFEIPAGKSIVLKFIPDTTEIIRLITANNNIKINKIHNLSLDTVNEFNLSDITDLFRLNNFYLLELCNVLNENIQTNVTKTSINIWNSPTFDPTTTSNYFSFTAPKTSTFVFSFTYSISSLNIAFFDSYCNIVSASEYFGIGYNTIKIYLVKDQQIYIKITDFSIENEIITSDCSSEDSSYVWFINNVACPSASYDVKVGIETTLVLALHINNNLIITDLTINNSGSYHISILNNSITFKADCRVSGGELSLYAGVKIGEESYLYNKKLVINTVLNIVNNAYAFNDNSGVGFKWNELNITKITYNVIPGTDPANPIYSTDNTANLANLFTDYIGYATIQIISISYKGKDKAGSIRFDTIYNGEKGFSCSNLSIHSKFKGGTGSSSNPYDINCVRHFNNIPSDTTAYFLQTATLAFNDQATARGKTFSGNYNANYKVIGRVKITDNNPNQLIGGLFDVNNGVISNILLMTVNITLTSTNNIVGCVVGRNFGTILDCSVGSSSGVSLDIGEGDIGGIAGINNGTLQSVYANITIVGYGDMGGLVGVNYGNIFDSTFDGTINYDTSANGNSGGIAGLNLSSGNIVNCTAYGSLNYTAPENNDGWDLAPCLGKIIGNNYGAYSNVNGYINVNTGSLKTLELKWYNWGWHYYYWYQTQYAGNRNVGYPI